MPHPLLLIVLVMLAILAAESPAEAYLDPGAGSMLLQVLLGEPLRSASSVSCSGVACPRRFAGDDPRTGSSRS